MSGRCHGRNSRGGTCGRQLYKCPKCNHVGCDAKQGDCQNGGYVTYRCPVCNAPYRDKVT